MLINSQFQLIRKKLSKVVEFHFYPQGKILYLENHLAHSMFFMLTGEILVTQLTFDKIKETFVDESKNILSSGDFFGHLALIYNTTRNATCKTQSKFRCVIYVSDLIIERVLKVIY